MIVYLADLTHTGQLVASNVFPLGIGLIGANILKEIPGADVTLYKYPDDLARAVHLRQPHVLGISNYSWNCNIGHEYARRIKEAYPQVIVIAGGPNYGSTDEEHEDYWQRFPWVDFYIYKEGEVAMVQLLNELAKHIFRTDPLSETTKGAFRLPSTHQLHHGQIIKNTLLPRVRSLDDLPSPYTAGLMDKFFDGILIPMTHTTRGCPFKCSFCTEGTAYYDKVAKRSTLGEDLEYIGQRKGTIQDLYISDANFGMFKEDRQKALAIADIFTSLGGRITKRDFWRLLQLSGNGGVWELRLASSRQTVQFSTTSGETIYLWNNLPVSLKRAPRSTPTPTPKLSSTSPAIVFKPIPNP